MRLPLIYDTGSAVKRVDKAAALDGQQRGWRRLVLWIGLKGRFGTQGD